MSIKYIFFSLFVYTQIQPDYYIYPVGYINNGNIVFFIEQKAVNNIQLLAWNQTTKTFESALWSLFNPAYVQILPNETGFSFLDNGRLRIKYFNKRSAKTIDFDQYIYSIHHINWINSYEFYCSAKTVNNNYAIFLGNIDGGIQYLEHSNVGDCMYPQKINDDLFYIHRTKYNTYSIIHTQFLSEKVMRQEIIDFKEEPIVFLSMISLEKGFVVTHKKSYAAQDKETEFKYYLLEKQESIWKIKYLFSFNIPLSLLSSDSQDRLYESLMPLIPNYKNSRIYFVDSKNNKKNILELFVYDLKSSMVKQVSFAKHRKYKHLFVPIIIGTQIVLGGSISK